MDNALKSYDDSRDWIFERLVHGPRGFYNELPESFSLEEYSSPTRHQGMRGTCGAFAAVKIEEIGAERKKITGRKCKSWVYLSPEFIYFHRANKPLSGMYGRDVFQVLRKYGTVTEDQYPYAQDDNETKPPAESLYKSAEEHKITGYARIKTIEGLKRAIIEIGACYIGLPMYNRTDRFWDRSCGNELSMGHAVAAIGYTADGFIIENSWGSNWGNTGRSLFPYSDFDIIWEIWVPVKQDS